MPLLRYSDTFRNSGSYPHKVRVKVGSVEAAKRWATSYSKAECISTGWHNNVTFHFDDASDALIFKLSFG